MVRGSENWELPWQVLKALLGTKNIELPEGKGGKLTLLSLRGAIATKQSDTLDCFALKGSQ